MPLVSFLCTVSICAFFCLCKHRRMSVLYVCLFILDFLLLLVCLYFLFLFVCQHAECIQSVLYPEAACLWLSGWPCVQSSVRLNSVLLLRDQLC